jgi:glycerol-3-phosphate dehydrogenase
MYDIIIIGAGVIGACIARELSKYNVKTVLLEKQSDVSCGSSKANSGIVHGGYDALPGTKKAKFNVLGNRMYEKLNHELNFGYLKTGSFVLSFSAEENQILYKLMDQGHKNGVRGLKILNSDAVFKKEPHVSKELTLGIHCHEAGIVSPYEMVIALAENAVRNGVQLMLNSEVKKITKKDGIFTVVTDKRSIQSKFIINAAGLFSDIISGLAGAERFTITPRKGQYMLFDKTQGHLAKSVLFQVPGVKGKGILVTRTYHGNLMIGPNSEETQNREDLGTDQKNLDAIVHEARKTVPGFNLKKAIKSFSGLRATCDRHDFIIEESEKIKQFINVAGIESPGLTSAPAIAEEILNILDNAGLELPKNETFNAERKAVIIKKDPEFKGKVDHTDPDNNIICRCENVTESEILDSMNRGIAVESADAVKRRTRAGMGFCQGKFCRPRVEKLISTASDNS